MPLPAVQDNDHKKMYGEFVVFYEIAVLFSYWNFSPLGRGKPLPYAVFFCVTRGIRRFTLVSKLIEKFADPLHKFAERLHKALDGLGKAHDLVLGLVYLLDRPLHVLHPLLELVRIQLFH